MRQILTGHDAAGWSVQELDGELRTSGTERKYRITDANTGGGEGGTSLHWQLLPVQNDVFRATLFSKFYDSTQPRQLLHLCLAT